MPQTSAQRQATYRARCTTGDGDYRLNTWISAASHLALRRLARRCGVTRRALIERLILAADQELLDTLERDTPEWDRYFGVTP